MTTIETCGGGGGAGFGYKDSVTGTGTNGIVGSADIDVNWREAALYLYRLLRRIEANASLVKRLESDDIADALREAERFEPALRQFMVDE